MTSASDFEAFAQRLLQLLDEGSFVATYKFAVLLGLLDVLSEGAGPTGAAPETVGTRDLARAVLDIYWPHTRSFQSYGTLLQNPRVQGTILRLIGEFRELTVKDATAPLSRARQAKPDAFEVLLRGIEWTLIEMPLGRLQRIGNRDRPFIYELGWDEMPKKSAIRSGAFEGELYLLPGVGDHMLRASALLRPLVQRSWTLAVARLNNMPEPELEDFLFGSRRISLAPITTGLGDLADGRCFYCHKPVQRRAAIDHFLPWARHIDNGIENLVYSHEKCNGEKRDYLAAEEHLERWVARMALKASAADLKELASARKWESHPDTTLAVARSIYLRLPADYQLWQLEARFTPVDHGRLSAALASPPGPA